jgi:quinohemoprotein amine dehydrogenase
MRAIHPTLGVTAFLLAGAVSAGNAQSDTLPGYPIRDATVVAQCASCHAQDSTGRMTRISYLRKTPEGWESSIRRMVTLNNAQLEPEAARAVLRYLADHQGLAPEEAKPGRFEFERRMIEYRYTEDERVEGTCRACHSMGRVITQRRTKEEWGLVVAMHRGYYPGVDFQGFRRGGPPGPDEDATHPMDRAINHLSSAFPLRTPEWSAWQATMRVPRVEGSWLLSGFEPGRGPFFGRVTITPVNSKAGEFTTEASYVFVRSGERKRRTGQSIVYTGYQWRGRSSENADQDPWREVMLVEPGWREMSGRWFTGAYDEFGMDVSLRRVGGDAMIAGAHPRAIRSGAAATEVRIHGANLPTSIAPANIDLGPGVRVERVVNAAPDMLTLMVRADSTAATGVRDLFLAGAGLQAGLAVYDSVSRIKVEPQAGMARVGGVVFPKQMQWFEAMASNDGADGKPDTPDDVPLGPMTVTWSLEEYGVTYDDDDVQFVGALDARGLFTPAVDGPNPRRSRDRNNIGDVWVVATWTSPGPNPRTLKARGHLLVTVPLYMRWEPWRIER